MAYYAALVPLVHLLEDIVLRDRYPTFRLGKKSIMKSLHEKFSFLGESLQNYSSKGDEAADRLEGRIRDAACRAQDIIESQISNHIKLGRTSRVLSIISRPDKELKKVRQDVDSIVEELMVMKKSCRNETLQPKDYYAATSAVERRSTRVNTMVGFDEYMISIKDQLCGQSSQLRVIPIIGMGGIGKTTLARNSFDDALVVYHFDCRVWVTISQHFYSYRVLQSILKSMGIETHELCGKSEEELKEHTYRFLKGRRYLIVIDDVWDTNVWDDLKRIFPNDNKGSRILLTTRLYDVAHYASNPDFFHEIHFLDVNASWSLLQDKVFAQESCPPELEDIGKLIASKCGGLPLAIVVIAGMLSNTRKPLYWRKVARNVGSFLSRDDEHLSNILSLSFNHLSHVLKSCFLYMGGFLEDYVINISKLIRLWVAEGFLDSVDGCKTLEQVAKECVEDLVSRNLVIITKKRANGQFKKCILHDLVRDFCRQRALHECFFHETNWKSYLCKPGTGTARRIIPCSYNEPWGFGNHIYVRTILWFRKSTFYNNLCQRDNYKLLKVLDISDGELDFELLGVPWMFHLKYLAVRQPPHSFYWLLPSIFKLQNLQTLVIDHHLYNSIPLPSEFWQRPRVRHIIISRMTLPNIPMVGGIPIRILEDLQTLATVCDFVFTNEAIEMIPNLRKLKIQCIKTEASGVWELYCLNHLVHLRQLLELKITFSLTTLPYINSFPSSFVLPQNLNKLSLGSCRLPWKDLTVVGSLPCLQVLKLKFDACVGEEWEPIEGEFFQLKVLLIQHLFDLKHWRADDMHFPRLEHLKIINCRDLEEIPLEIGDIPTLELITVYDSKHAGESAMLILEEQRSQGNDTLQVLVRN